MFNHQILKNKIYYYSYLNLNYANYMSDFICGLCTRIFPRHMYTIKYSHSKPCLASVLAI